MHITNSTGAFDIVELLNFLKLEASPFTRRVFSMFDNGGTGSISFDDFVTTTWSYCSLTEQNIAVFAFNMYDKSKSGFITGDDMREWIRDVYGKSYECNSLAVKCVFCL